MTCLRDGLVCLQSTVADPVSAPKKNEPPRVKASYQAQTHTLPIALKICVAEGWQQWPPRKCPRADQQKRGGM